MVVDSRRIDPGNIGLEDILAGTVEPERSDQAERNQEDRRGHNQAEGSDGALALFGENKNDQKRDQRQEDDYVEDRHRVAPPNPIANSSNTEPRTTQAA
jgi:hypothetical protein